MLRRVALVTLLTAGCAAPPESVVVVTRSAFTGIETGPHAELCAGMQAAEELIAQQDFVAAEAVVDRMLADFARATAGSDGRLVSVATQAEFEELRQGAPGERLVPLDWCYREILHWKAFLRAHQRDFPTALAILDDEARIAPTAAPPFVERGFILNQIGRFAEARAAYEHALALIDRYPEQLRRRRQP